MIAIFLCFVLFSSVRTEDHGPCSKCKHQRIRGMQSADCYDAKLRDIPQCLNPGIEVLDLSYNRIKKVKKNDLERYSSLKYLYLTENTIIDIDEEALAEKLSLEILDISDNVFRSIPKVIFQLPSLKRLYLSQNHNTNIAEEIEKSTPIKSPLIKLDISYNEIKKLPNLGELPTLVYYNISGNQDVLVKPSNFAGLCMLETLVVQNFSAVFENSCDCFNLQRWLLERKVVLIENFNCIASNLECEYVIPQEDLQAHEECLENNKKKVIKGFILKIGLPACLIIAGAVAIVIWYYYKRVIKKRNRRRSVRCNATVPLYKPPL